MRISHEQGARSDRINRLFRSKTFRSAMLFVSLTESAAGVAAARHVDNRATIVTSGLRAVEPTSRTIPTSTTIFVNPDTSTSTIFVAPPPTASPEITAPPPKETATKTEPTFTEPTSASTTDSYPLASSPNPSSTFHDRTVKSTAYCDTNSGVGLAKEGDIAMNDEPQRAHVDVLSGPMAGHRFIIDDTYGYGTQLDIWFRSCDAALVYGNPDIAVRVYDN